MVHHLRLLLEERGAVVGDPVEEQLELEQEAADALPRPKDCCVCYGRVSTVLFLGCLHLCLCGPCKNKILETQNTPPVVLRAVPRGQRGVACPICRHQNSEAELVGVIYNA